MTGGQEPDGVPTPGERAPDAACVYRWPGPPALELWRGPVTLPSGVTYTGHAMRTNPDTPGVVVVARRRDAVLLVRSLRPSVGRRMWELPRGFGDTGDSAADALRELRDETGLTGVDAHVVGSYVTDTSLLPGEVRVVVCHVNDGAEVGRRDGEIIEARWVPIDALAGLMAEGVIADAHTLAGIAVAGLLGGGRGECAGTSRD